MATKTKTGFDSYLDKRLKVPSFAAEYDKARTEIDRVDALVRFLDVTRLAASMPKAELARRIQAKPEIIRRLFTSQSPNPTMTTVIKIADALGLAVRLVPVRKSLTARRAHGAAGRPHRKTA